MNQKQLWANLHQINCQVYDYDVIDSTNSEAKRLAMNSAGLKDEAILVLAEEQTSGRGRRGRTWESPKGGSIYMSLLLCPDILPNKASMLTLVMGLSVVEGLEQELGIKCQMKWPNDVIYNKKKLVGILTEMGLRGMEIDYVIIGVGINVNIVNFPEALHDKATSLQLELGYTVDREKLVKAVMERFWQNYQIFLETEDLSGLKERYEAVLVNLNQPVRVLEPNNEYEGVARGINTMGELLVERLDGTYEEVYAGEVSVRGLYSYV